jgi:hypothetical protein
MVDTLSTSPHWVLVKPNSSEIGFAAMEIFLRVK